MLPLGDWVSPDRYLAQLHYHRAVSQALDASLGQTMTRLRQSFQPVVGGPQYEPGGRVPTRQTYPSLGAPQPQITPTPLRPTAVPIPGPTSDQEQAIWQSRLEDVLRGGESPLEAQRRGELSAAPIPPWAETRSALMRGAMTPLVPESALEAVGGLPIVGPSAELALRFGTSPAAIAATAIPPLRAPMLWGLAGQTAGGAVGQAAEELGAPVVDVGPMNIGPRGVGEAIGGLYAGPRRLLSGAPKLTEEGFALGREGIPRIRVGDDVVLIDSAGRRSQPFKVDKIRTERGERVLDSGKMRGVPLENIRKIEDVAAFTEIGPPLGRPAAAPTEAAPVTRVGEMPPKPTKKEFDDLTRLEAMEEAETITPAGERKLEALSAKVRAYGRADRLAREAAEPPPVTRVGAEAAPEPVVSGAEQAAPPVTSAERPAPPPPTEPPRPTIEGAVPEPGGVPDAAMRELIGAEAVTPQLNRMDRAVNLLKRTLGMGTEEEATASTLMRQRRNLRHTVETLSNRFGAAGGKLVRQAFKTDDLGRIHTLPGNPTVQDVAARLPEYEAMLTDQQRAALEWLRREADPYGAALREQGIEFGSRPDVMEGGFYLPRGRADIEGADMPVKKVGVGGKVGARRGFERTAVFDRMTDGIDAGYRYAPLDETLQSYAADAGNRALDAYTANLFKTAVDESGQLLGETAHARLLRQNSGIAARVENLRKAVNSLKRNVGTLGRHHEEVLARFASSPGPDLEELDVALRELRQRPMRSVRGQTIAEARASLKDAQQQLREVMPDWKKALDRARQMPRGEGQIGFYQLQGTSYPDAVANAANKYLRAEAPPSGAGTALTSAIGAVNNLLRGIRATADVSFTGIQGLLGLVHKPNSYRRAMQAAIRGIGDKDALGRFILEFDARAAAEGGLSSHEWLKAGLQMGGVDTEFMIGRGAGAIGQRVGALPVVKQANRAFGYFGDTLRLDAAQGMLRASGTQDAKAIAEVANLMTGWSKGRFLGDVGNLVQFAPRFFQSQLDFLARAAVNRGPAGNQARLALLKLVGAGTLVTVAANEAIGNKGFDYLTPLKNGRLNPNFMRIRFKGTDYSVFGPWDSLLRGIVSAGKGDLTYITRSKASPAVGMAWDAITGRTFMGKEFGVESFLRGLLPFSLSEIGEEGLLQTAISSTGIKAAPMTPTERLMAAWQEKYPDRPFDSTSWKIAEQDPDLAPLVQDVYARGAERGTAGAERGARAEEARLTAEQETGLIREAQGIADGKPGAEARFAEAFEKARDRAVGAGDVLYAGLSREAKTKAEKAVDAYYAFRDTMMDDDRFRDPATDEFDKDAAYAELDNLYEAIPKDVRTAMEADIKSIDPLVAKYEPEYREAANIRNQVYDLPRYRGTTPEEEKQLTEFIAFARHEWQTAKYQNPDFALSQTEVAEILGRKNGDSELGHAAAVVISGKAVTNPDRIDLVLQNKDLLTRYFPYFVDKILPIGVLRSELGEEEFERVIAR